MKIALPLASERRELRPDLSESGTANHGSEQGAWSSDNSVNVVAWSCIRKRMQDIQELLQETTSDSEHMARVGFLHDEFSFSSVLAGGLVFPTMRPMLRMKACRGKF